MPACDGRRDRQRRLLGPDVLRRPERPSNETGHYLLDNIRSIPDVVPSLLGIAQDGSTLKAIFDYQTTSSTPVNIPYGTANGLTNQNGFIASPPEVPPTTFVSDDARALRGDAVGIAPDVDGREPQRDGDAEPRTSCR